MLKKFIMNNNIRETYSIPSKPCNIGLFGFGVVGRGLFDILRKHNPVNASIKTICTRSGNKNNETAFKNFTTNPNDILLDNSIDVVVELIDDTDAAFEIVKQALRLRKPVISANKKMIAAHLPELLALQHRYDTGLLYEGSCCAGIPIIRTLEDHYGNDRLCSIRGIVNGSTNYILTEMQQHNSSFSSALKTAQLLGFAESDPALDVKGYDAANKLSILALHAFGIMVPAPGIIFSGIEQVTSSDIIFATKNSCSIRLVAQAIELPGNRLAAFVLPQLVKDTDDLYYVTEEFNALTIESRLAGSHFLKGKGAGAFPTAAAVLADIAALQGRNRYAYKKLHQKQKPELTNSYYLRVHINTDDTGKIANHDFDWLEPWQTENGNYRSQGLISAEKLLKSNWWKKQGVSLMADVQPVASDKAEKLQSAARTVKQHEEILS